MLLLGAGPTLCSDCCRWAPSAPLIPEGASFGLEGRGRPKLMGYEDTGVIFGKQPLECVVPTDAPDGSLLAFEVNPPLPSLAFGELQYRVRKRCLWDGQA